MIQRLCYTGKGFNTCWRPASIGANPAVGIAHNDGVAAPYTPIRFFTGDFV